MKLAKILREKLKQEVKTKCRAKEVRDLKNEIKKIENEITY